MPFEIKPSTNPHVLFGRYYGDVSVDDVQGVTDACLAYLDSNDVSQVHVLMDFGGVTSQPTNLLKIFPAARPIITHEKMGWWVLWGVENAILRYIIGMVARMSRIRFKEVTDREAALAFIADAAQLQVNPEEIVPS